MMISCQFQLLIVFIGIHLVTRTSQDSALTGSKESGDQDCPDGWLIDTSEQMCYKFHYELKTQPEAKGYCEGENSHLVVIGTQEKSDRINELRPRKGVKYWIGLERVKGTNQFRWIDGSTRSYTNWNLNENQPDNSPNQDCVYLHPEGKWNDIPCTRTFYPICEITAASNENATTTEPATVLSESGCTSTIPSPTSEPAPASIEKAPMTDPSTTPEEPVSSTGMTTALGPSKSTGITPASTERTPITDPAPTLAESHFTPGKTVNGEPSTSKEPMSGPRVITTIANSAATSYERVSTTDRKTTSLSRTTKNHPNTCTKQIGKRKINISPQSSLVAVGRPGLTSNAASSYMTCHNGSWQSDFPVFTDINECAEDKHICSPYITNRECTNNIGSYKCTCRDGFLRLGDTLCIPSPLMDKYCKLDATESTCDEETDRTTITLWKSTPSNCGTDWVPCPAGYSGKMMRFCDANANWWPVYTTECKSQQLLKLNDKVNDTIDVSEAAKILEDIAEQLDNSLSGDLLLSMNIISDIIDKKALSSKGRQNERMRYIKSMVEVASKLLDGDKEEMWSQIHETRGTNAGSITLIETLEIFGNDVYWYVTQYNENIRVSTKNIGFEARVPRGEYNSFIFPSNAKSTRKRRSSSVWYKVDEGGSKVIIPRDNLMTNNSGNTTVIAFTYKNPKNIIPPGMKKQQGRQWVRTITATKKVEKVNSPVISVNIYDGKDSMRGRRLQEPITFVLYHKEPGYNTKCLSMVYGDPSGVLDQMHCQNMDDKTTGFTECKCYHVGSVALVMTMGTKPVPFLDSALRTIIVIGNGVGAFLSVFTFITLCMRRITTDHYFVCGSISLSLSLYSIVVVVALNVNKETVSCRISAILNHYILISCCAWVFNFCLQHYLKLRFCVHKNTYAKAFYVIHGWIVPLLFVVPSALRWSASYIRSQNCLVPDNTEHFMAIVIPAACLTLASLILIMFMCYKFDHLVFTHGSGLWYILRDEFCRISLIVPTFAVTWIIGLQDVTGNMYYGYTYAFACFVVGSVCYLAFFATNKVVLRSIRSRFYGNGDDDPDEISFSPYGSDDEEDEYIDTIPARSRPSSNVPTSSKASVCVLEMQSLSRRTTPGEVTIAEHGESSGESSTRLSGQARVSRDVTHVPEESSEEDDVDHVVGSTLFYKLAN